MKIFPLNLLLISLALLFSTSSWAQFQTVTTQATATAETQDKALAKALSQAVQQELGVSVNTSVDITETAPKIRLNIWGTQTILDSKEINQGHLKTLSSGPIKSFKVLNSQALKDAKLWQVTIEATLLKYQNLGEDRSKLTQLVVFPFRSSEAIFPELSEKVSATEVSEKLSQFLTNNFTQTNKFRVLDRQYWVESGLESHILRGHNTTPQEQVKLGQKLGADYMLVGSIERFHIEKSSKSVYASAIERYTATFDLDYRLIELATGEIRHSGHLKLDYDRDQTRNLLTKIRPDKYKKDERKAEEELVDHLYGSVAEKLSQEVFNQVYPIKVLSVESRNEIYLSRGGEGIQAGDRFSIHNKSKILKDPDTHLNIHTSGPQIAMIEITGSTNQYALGKLLEGDLSAITPGVTAHASLGQSNQGAKTTENKPLTPGSSEKPWSW